MGNRIGSLRSSLSLFLFYAIPIAWLVAGASFPTRLFSTSLGMMGCLEAWDYVLLKRMRKGFGRFLNEDGFELLLVDPQQFIDLEFHILTDTQSFGV